MDTTNVDVASCARTHDAARYVLGELTGRQRESFTRHLRRCERCADEVELLHQAADAVALLAGRHTPIPEGAGVEASVPGNAQSARRTGGAGGSGGAGGAGGAGGRGPTRPQLRALQGGAGGSYSSDGRGPVRRLLQSPVPRPVLVSLIGLAIIGVATLALSKRVLNRSAGLRYERVEAGWSPGGAALQFSGDHLELLVKDMPRPRRGTGYQVWLGSKLTNALTPTDHWLRLDRRGDDGLTLAGDYHDWYVIAVYVEPLRGRDTIKSGAVVVGDLRQLR